MDRLQGIEVELSVVLGRAQVTLGDLLRLPRGAVIRLDARMSDEVWVLAGGHPVARGRVRIDGGRVKVAITRRANSRTAERDEPTPP